MRWTPFLSLLLAGAPLIAQTPTATLFKTYDFANDASQGAGAYGGVIQATDGNIYGVTQYGGAGNNGTLFRITPSGVVSVVHSFAGGTSDGVSPNAVIELPDGNLYGTTTFGGTSNRGTIFKITFGGAETILYNFTNQLTDGDNPYGSIIYDGTYIYGTTYADDNDATSSGTLWKFNPDSPSGSGNPFVILLFDNSSNKAFGQYPWNGVTDIDGVLYGTSWTGGIDNCGALWSAAINGLDNQLLHSFTNGTDGCNPYAAPRYSSAGLLFGTTNQYQASKTDFGSVYSSGLEPDQLTDNASYSSAAYPDGPVAFDSSGDALFATGQGGSSENGALAWMHISSSLPNATEVLYSFPASGAPGNLPTSVPFIDNQGHLWLELYDGGLSKGYGGVAVLNVSTISGAPIQVSISPASPSAGSPATVSWKVTNAFSTNEQYCFATGGPGAWAGHQTGTYASGVYSGSASVTFPARGTYSLALNCGGTETGLVTATVTSARTTTALAASPNPVAYGQNITLTATVSTAIGTPTGTVTFSAAGSPLATVALNSSAVARLTAPTSGEPLGTYPITAAYSGDSNNLASTSTSQNVVLTKDSTATALTVSPTTVTPPADVTLTAKVTKSSSGVTGTPGGSVTFKANGVPLATVALVSGTATLKASSQGQAAGKYSVTAVYSGDSVDNTSTSTPVSVTLQ